MIITRRTQCAWLYFREEVFFLLITQVHLKAVSAANASSCDLDAL
jgi:hypothetical protein